MEIDLIKIFKIFFRKWVLFCAIIILFGVAGYILSSVLPSTYEAEGLVSLPTEYNLVKGSKETILPVYIYREYFESLDKLLLQRDLYHLSEITDIDQEILSELTKIKFKVIGAFLVKVRVEGKNPEKVYKSCSALLKMIDNIDGVDKYVSKKRKQILEYINNLKRKSDSVSKLYQKANKINLYYDPNLAFIEFQKEIMQKRLLLENLRLSEVLIPPIKPNKPFKPRKIFIVFTFMIMGLIIDFFITIYLIYIEEK